MAIPYAATGRTSQKARTASAMVAAARAWLAEGVTPTVEQAAERAGVSRTTAYRYYPNQRELLIAAYPEIDASSLLGSDPPSDPFERFERFAAAFTRQILEHEPELRAMLRLSLETPAGEPLPLRRGRALDWIADALQPLRRQMPDAELRRLALAIRATLGIEALVWLTDIGGLSSAEAAELMRDSARTLLRAALDQPS